MLQACCTRAATATEATHEETAEDADWVTVQEAVFNPFDELDVDVLKSLQSLMTENGLNTEEGAAKLSTLGPSDREYQELVEQLVALRFSTAHAREQLTKWQAAQRELQKELQRMKEQQKQQVLTQEAIWFCAVCGAGGYPTPVCFVAPYIKYYRAVMISK